jgi:hypothetical protein
LLKEKRGGREEEGNGRKGRTARLDRPTWCGRCFRGKKPAKGLITTGWRERYGGGGREAKERIRNVARPEIVRGRETKWLWKAAFPRRESKKQKKEKIAHSTPYWGNLFASAGLPVVVGPRGGGGGFQPRK